MMAGTPGMRCHSPSVPKGAELWGWGIGTTRHRGWTPGTCSTRLVNSPGVVTTAFDIGVRCCCSGNLENETADPAESPDCSL